MEEATDGNEEAGLGSGEVSEVRYFFFGMVLVVPWRFGVVGFGFLRQRWVRKIDKAVELAESNGR